MKRLIIGLVIILLLVSCQTNVPEIKESETVPETTEVVDLPKRLHFSEKSDPPSLHPWYATDERSILILGNINSGLFNMNDNREVTNDLVRQTEVSENGLVYTFYLKTASFVNHEGEVVAPITADDFVYAWKKLADPSTDSPHRRLLETAGIKGAAELNRLYERLEELDQKIQLVNELTVEDFSATERFSAEQLFMERLNELHQWITEETEKLEEEYESIEAAQKLLQTMIDQLGIKSRGDTALIVELERPVPFLKEILCFPAFYPINQSFHADYKTDYATHLETSLFSGPFFLSSWEPGVEFVLDKNEHYWESYAITLEGVNLSIDNDITPEGLVEAYLNGEVDWTSLTGEKIEKYSNRPDTWYRMDASVVYVEVNQNIISDRRYRKLLSDPDARKALQMVLDKTKLMDQVLNNGSIASDVLYPRSFQQLNGRDIRLIDSAYSDGYNLFDSETAEQLWMNAKERAGLSWAVLDLMVADSPNAEKIAGFLKAEWERLLPETTIQINEVTISDKIKMTEQGDYQLALSAWTPDYPDILSFAETWVSHSGHNTAKYSNLEYDELVAQAQSDKLALPGNELKRIETLLEAERILLEVDQAIIPLYQRGAIDLLNPAIRNLTVQIVGPRFQFKYVEIERESK